MSRLCRDRNTTKSYTRSSSGFEWLPACETGKNAPGARANFFAMAPGHILRVETGSRANREHTDWDFSDSNTLTFW